MDKKKYRVVEHLHGPINLAKMITGELKAEDNQKLLCFANGVADYHAFQNLLSRATKFLEEPDKIRFFFTTAATFDFHVVILEEIDG
jgi:hypothetical protein